MAFSRPLVLPAPMNSLFNKVLYPKGEEVKVYFWDIRVGTERAGHVAMQVGEAYYSFWADSSPNARAAGGNAGMYFVNAHEQDLVIAGRRVQLYSELRFSTQNPGDPNSVVLPDVKTMLQQLDVPELAMQSIKTLGQPSQVLSLYSLDTASMKHYLRGVVAHPQDYRWDKMGKAKQGFNCASFIFKALKLGGIEKLIPSSADTLRRIGCVGAAIALPLFLKNDWSERWWMIAVGVVASTAAGGALGGLIDAQSRIDAGCRVMNANSSDVPCLFMTKAAIWLAGSILSALSGAVGVDHLLDHVFVSPGQLSEMVYTAQKIERSRYTLGEPGARNAEGPVRAAL